MQKIFWVCNFLDFWLVIFTFREPTKAETIMLGPARRWEWAIVQQHSTTLRYAVFPTLAEFSKRLLQYEEHLNKIMT